MVTDRGHQNYHAPEAWETQRRNRRLRLSLLDGFRLEDDEPSVVLPEGSQRLLAFLALKGRPIRRPVVGGTLWPVATEGSRVLQPSIRAGPPAERSSRCGEGHRPRDRAVARGHRGSEGHVWLTQRPAPVTVGESEWRYVLHRGMTTADRGARTAGGIGRRELWRRIRHRRHPTRS